MAQIERQQTVLNILQNLQDLRGLKKLFWEELNYEREIALCKETPQIWKAAGLDGRGLCCNCTG